MEQQQGQLFASIESLALLAEEQRNRLKEQNEITAKLKEILTTKTVGRNKLRDQCKNIQYKLGGICIELERRQEYFEQILNQYNSAFSQLQKLQSRVVYLKQREDQYKEEFSKLRAQYSAFESSQKEYFSNPLSSTLVKNYHQSMQELQCSQSQLLQIQNEKVEAERRLQEKQTKNSEFRNSLIAYEDQIKDIGLKAETCKRNQVENDSKINQMANELQAKSNLVQQIEMEVSQLTAQNSALEKQLHVKRVSVSNLEKEARNLFQKLKSKQSQ